MGPLYSSLTQYMLTQRLVASNFTETNVMLRQAMVASLTGKSLNAHKKK